MRHSGAYVSERMTTEIEEVAGANELRIQQMAGTKKKEAEEGLTKKAKQTLEKMTGEEKRSKVPESPVVQFGSPTYDRLVLSEIKAGLEE